MARAIEQLREHPGEPVYTELFFRQGVKFQYPVSSLVILDFTQRWTGADWPTLFRWCNALCWVCVPAIGIVAGLQLNAITSSTLTAVAGRGSRVVPQALIFTFCILIVLSFYPITRSYTLGQIQTPMTLMAGLALLAWQRGQRQVSGFWVGLCCAIKPHWAVVLLWSALRRELRFVVASVLTFFGLLAVAAYEYGVVNLKDYLSVLSYISQRGESYYANQSINGLVNRMLHNGNNLSWVKHEFPPYHVAVHAATVVSSILILVGTFFWTRRRFPEVLDLALVLLALTIASPIAWEHHYGVVVPVMAAVLWRTGRKSPEQGRWTWVLFAAAYFLVGQKLEPLTNRFADSSANILQSYILFGGLILWATMLRQAAASSAHDKGRDYS